MGAESAAAAGPALTAGPPTGSLLRRPEIVCGPGTALEWAKGPFVGGDPFRGASQAPVIVLHGASGLDRYGGLETALRRFPGGILCYAIAAEPTDAVVDQILSDARGSRPAAVIGIGGGAVLDAAKVVAAMLCVEGPTVAYLEGVGDRKHPGNRLPLVCMPTTGGTGSEATSNGVVSGSLDGRSEGSSGGYKKSLRHPNFVPDLAILDPDLMVGVPAEVSAASGIDALTQLLESHFSRRATALSRLWTSWGLELAARHLEPAVFDGGDKEARLGMALAAHASGIGLANAGLGLVHGIAGPLGAAVPVPHGVACARLFGPCQTRFFRQLALERHPAHAEALRIAGHFVGTGGSDAKRLERWNDYLAGLADRLGVPELKAWGVDSSLLPDLSDAASNRDSLVELSREDIDRALEEAIRR